MAMKAFLSCSPMSWMVQMLGVQSRGCLGFALKSCESLRVFRDIFWKEFKSDKTVKTNVFGFVDHAHATAAQFFRDPVVGYGLADERGGICHRSVKPKHSRNSCRSS
jgi:hypothetical protein